MPIVFPTIRLKRGLKSSLPALALGELGFCTDTNELFIGTSSGNRQIYPMEHQFVLNPVDTNTWYIPYATNGTALTGLAVAASRVHFIPFIVHARLTISSLAINVTAAAAGTAQLGVYDTQNFRPNALLASVTGLNTGTTGIKSGNVNVPLVPNRIYWLAMAVSGTPTLQAVSPAGAHANLGVAITGSAFNTYYFASGSTLPNPAPTTLTNSTGVIPAIFVRFA